MMETQSVDQDSSGYDDSSSNGRSPLSSNTSTIPPRGDEIDRWQRHISMQDLAKQIESAAGSVYPNKDRSRYSNVYVLILKWKTEDPNLPVSLEIAELCKVFDELYHYDIEIFEISDQKSHALVSKKINEFVDINGDCKNDLKIVYYAGHSSLSKTRDLVLSSWQDKKSAKGSTIHARLIADGGEGNGVTELMSACAFDVKANGVGHYSFTKALTIELRLMSKKRSFPVVDLYTEVYSRAQHHMAQGLKNERYPAPIHLVLTKDEQFPRCIELSIQGPRLEQNFGSPEVNHQKGSANKHTGSRKRSRDDELESPSNKRPRVEDADQSEGQASTPPQQEAAEPSLIPFCHQPPEGGIVCSKSSFGLSSRRKDGPRLLFSIRLEDNIRAEDLSAGYFKDWLRIIPAIAMSVTVEGAFTSIVPLGIIKSSNLLLMSPPALDKPTVEIGQKPVLNVPEKSANALASKFSDPIEPTIEQVKLLPQTAFKDWMLHGRVPNDHVPNCSTPMDWEADCTLESDDEDSIFTSALSPDDRASKTGSTNTAPSELGAESIKNHFSKRSSAYSEISSRYQELSVDPASHRSSQGPLFSVVSTKGTPVKLRKRFTESAKAEVKAMRKDGSCWRCKFLYIRCDIEDPCSSCSGSRGTRWGSVGCKRGSLWYNLPPLRLCPKSQSTSAPVSGPSQPALMNILENQCSRMHAMERERSLLDFQILEITTSRYSRVEGKPKANVFLNGCILELFWEVSGHSWTDHLFTDLLTSENLFRLLAAAAQHQVTLESDNLIAKSLFCLRSALQALGVKARIGLTELSHQRCEPTSCSVECLLNLSLNLKVYLNELSKVFSWMRNMENRDHWWLSIFYSLCIQSVVRRALLEINHSTKGLSSTMDGDTVFKGYLHLPVRAFIAISGHFDPIVMAFESPHGDAKRKENFTAARQAVRQEMWDSEKINGFGDYLERLFEDKG